MWSPKHAKPQWTQCPTPMRSSLGPFACIITDMITFGMITGSSNELSSLRWDSFDIDHSRQMMFFFLVGLFNRYIKDIRPFTNDKNHNPGSLHAYQVQKRHYSLLLHKYMVISGVISLLTFIIHTKQAFDFVMWCPTSNLKFHEVNWPLVKMKHIFTALVQLHCMLFHPQNKTFVFL